METLKEQDYKTALAIQKEINQLLALKMKAAGARHPANSERPRLKIVKA
jgi:hypothetical protein